MPVIPHYLRQRAPNANDDRLQFIFKDSTWRDETTSLLYRSDDDTAGAAVWTDITTGGGGPPDPHKGSHISGGGDAFTSSDLLEGVVKRIRTSQGPTDMLVGVVGDGQFLKRSGTALVGDLPTASPADPSYSPGSFTVITETSKTIGPRVKLTGTQRITVQGTGRLRITN